MTDTGPFWHGGGRLTGALILPSHETGVSRSGDTDVFVTTVRSLAETYASTVAGPAWVYEVEPEGVLTPVPPLIPGPTISYRCDRARIVRRFTLANTRRIELRRAVQRAAAHLDLGGVR